MAEILHRTADAIDLVRITDDRQIFHSGRAGVCVFGAGCVGGNGRRGGHKAGSGGIEKARAEGVTDHVRSLLGKGQFVIENKYCR